MFTQLFNRLDWIDPSEPITLVAPVVAAIAALTLTHPTVVSHVGDDAPFWRTVRGMLPGVDALGAVDVPTDRPLKVTDVEVGDASLSLSLGEGETTRGVFENIDRRFSGLAERL